MKYQLGSDYQHRLVINCVIPKAQQVLISMKRILNSLMIYTTILSIQIISGFIPTTFQNSVNREAFNAINVAVMCTTTQHRESLIKMGQKLVQGWALSGFNQVSSQFFAWQNLTHSLRLNPNVTVSVMPSQSESCPTSLHL